MAWVIFFVPEPARGVTEMVRVVRPVVLVTAYGWDKPGGGSPTEIFFSELPRIGIEAPLRPQASASRIELLHELWMAAGLEAVETHTITVQRIFASFDKFWEINTATNLKGTLAELDSATIGRLRNGSNCVFRRTPTGASRMGRVPMRSKEECRHDAGPTVHTGALNGCEQCLAH